MGKVKAMRVLPRKHVEYEELPLKFIWKTSIRGSLPVFDGRTVYSKSTRC